ncbi:MAG: metal-dependent hydrolase [Gammaproteobacteria bacterium]|nr:metal-dependent hydrolase [Gammaproteobacteria bacterium]
MDPISQGSLGAVLPQSVLRHENLGRLTLCGALAGMAPDLDIFIASDVDPLMFLVFHRQFTHALIFIPIGALVVAGCLFPFLRKSVEFKYIYLACLLGYATHGFLDSCTSYGTQLFWPFTDYRVSWNTVSVLDPAFTVPLLLAVIAGLIWRRRWLPWLGIAWAFAYLGVGLIQSQRALDAGERLAEARGHVPGRLTIKPSIANQLLWRSIYQHDDVFYVDAIRVGLTTEPMVCGTSATAEVLEVDRHLPWLEASQQLTDVSRFSWFSQDYVATDPAMPNRVIDVRYSTVPNQLVPLWAIDLDPTADPTEHVKFVNLRRVEETQLDLISSFFRGDQCHVIATTSSS